MVNAFMKLIGSELFCKRIIKNPLKIFFFFFFAFEPNLKTALGANFKIAKYVQKFFSLASLTVHHLTIFDSLIQRDLKLKLVKIKVSTQ